MTMTTSNETYLVHHGIKGQRWGVRRYQNEDGTYTELGKKRYFKEKHRIPQANTKDYKTLANRANDEQAVYYVNYLKNKGNRKKAAKEFIDDLRDIADMDDKVYEEVINKINKGDLSMFDDELIDELLENKLYNDKKLMKYTNRYFYAVSHKDDSFFLQHHGIKGQKWGVRRYQNSDGTLTEAGKVHYSKQEYKEAKKEYNKGYSKEASENYRVKRQEYKDTKKAYHESEEYEYYRNKAIKTGAVVAGTAAAVGLTAYAIKHPEQVKKLAQYAKDPKVQEFIKKSGSKAVKELEKRSIDVGKAMYDASLATIGGVAVSKIAKKLEPKETDSEKVKNQKKVTYEVSKAGIEAATRNNRNNNNNNNSNKGNNHSVGKEISDAIGTPSNRTNAKQDPKYSDLFKYSNGNNRDEETRSMIKKLANAGYDVDQIREYLNKKDNGQLSHSGMLYFVRFA